MEFAATWGVDMSLGINTCFEKLMGFTYTGQKICDIWAASPNTGTGYFVEDITGDYVHAQTPMPGNIIRIPCIILN